MVISQDTLLYRINLPTSTTRIYTTCVNYKETKETDKESSKHSFKDTPRCSKQFVYLQAKNVSYATSKTACGQIFKTQMFAYKCIYRN